MSLEYFAALKSIMATESASMFKIGDLVDSAIKNSTPEFRACVAARVETVTRTEERDGKTFFIIETKRPVGFIRNDQGLITEVIEKDQCTASAG